MPREIFTEENRSVPSDGDIVLNSYPDTLYSHDFNGGKFFSLISRETGRDFQMQFSPRVKFQVSFINSRDDLNGITIGKYRYTNTGGWLEDESEKITLSAFDFQKLIDFLQFLKDIDLRSVNERRIQLTDNSLEEINDETKQKINTLLSTPDGKTLIEELLNNGVISSKDLVNIGYRKEQLNIFNRLLTEEQFINTYAQENSLNVIYKEKIWQFFFEKNKWIFGYGLDYKFLSILQREASVSGTDLAGRGEEFTDFLAGCKNFTVVIEIKKPETNLFGADANRSGCWKLSNDLIGSMSQILEQKASWQVEAESGENFDGDGNSIRQKAFDPKAILIMGHTDQFLGEDRENKIKAKTFELFRRDSRNIEIITYDELFNRAKFIVENQEDSET